MKKRKSIWMAAAAVALAMLSALYCNCSIQREDWTISSGRIPAAFDGLRITLLTDLHGREFGTDNEALLEQVALSQPDLIAISGDLVDEHTDCSMLKPLLTGLCALAPTCYVTGNHEWVRRDTEAVLQQIADCGVTVLRNESITLERQGQTLILAGAEDPNGYADQMTPAQLMEQIRTRAEGDPYVIMLSHRNDALDLWADLDADLVLSGHGHGGVIRLPVLGGVLGVDRSLFPDDCEGCLTQGRTTVAVSRGLGGVRLWNRPHLPTIVLRAEP